MLPHFRPGYGKRHRRSWLLPPPTHHRGACSPLLQSTPAPIGHPVDKVGCAIAVRFVPPARGAAHWKSAEKLPTRRWLDHGEFPARDRAARSPVRPPAVRRWHNDKQRQYIRRARREFGPPANVKYHAVLPPVGYRSHYARPAIMPPHRGHPPGRVDSRSAVAKRASLPKARHLHHLTGRHHPARHHRAQQYERRRGLVAARVRPYPAAAGAAARSASGAIGPGLR